MRWSKGHFFSLSHLPLWQSGGGSPMVYEEVKGDCPPPPQIMTMVALKWKRWSKVTIPLPLWHRGGGGLLVNEVINGDCSPWLWSGPGWLLSPPPPSMTEWGWWPCGILGGSKAGHDRPLFLPSLPNLSTIINTQLQNTTKLTGQPITIILVINSVCHSQLIHIDHIMSRLCYSTQTNKIHISCG